MGFFLVYLSLIPAVRHNRVQNIPEICWNGLMAAILHHQLARPVWAALTSKDYEQKNNHRNHFYRGCPVKAGRHVGYRTAELGSFLDGVFRAGAAAVCGHRNADLQLEP